MFNKKLFSELLVKARGNRYTESFANESGVSRAYISGFINMKLDNPPTPDKIKKLADVSHNNITYEKLMAACGYIDEKTFVTSNIDLIRGNMTYEELADDIAAKLHNRHLLESMTPALLLKISEGKEKPQLSVIQILALYANVGRDFFFRENTLVSLYREQEARNKIHDAKLAMTLKALEITRKLCYSGLDLELIEMLIEGDDSEKYIKFALEMKKKGVDI